MRVYVSDHEDSRELDVVIKDKDSGTELHRFAARAADTQWRGASAKGYWLSYRLFGDVTVVAERVSGTNVTLQGLTFDPYAVTNHAPIAADKNVHAYVGNVSLSAAATDADGDALTYQWTQVSGDTVTLDDATAATPRFSAAAAGSFTFNVRVKDWSGADATATVTIDVAEAPVVSSYLSADGVTGPYWQAAGYGSAGYFIPAGQNGASANPGSYPLLGEPGNYDLASLPSGVALTWGADVRSWIWANPGDTTSRSIERPGMSGTVESCLWSESKLTVSVLLGGAVSRIMRLYLTDHENNRELDIRLKSADGATTYHTFEARASDPNWRGAGSKGYWLSYRIVEDVTVDITKLSADAILQAIV